MFSVHTLKFMTPAELLLEPIVEQGVVDLLCSSLSAHERHQGVQAVRGLEDTGPPHRGR